MRAKFFAPLLAALLAGPAAAAEWEPITAELLTREKPGYGGLSGVVVNHANGQIQFAVLVEVRDRHAGASPSSARGCQGATRGKGFSILKRAVTVA